MSRKLTPTVKCQVCYKRFKALSGHLRKHKTTTKQYKIDFNAPTISLLTLQRMKLARLRFIHKKKEVKYATERARKIAAANTGRKHSEETKEKIRNSLRGTTLSASHKLAISKGLLGHKVSDSTREKLKNVVITDLRRQRISESQSAEKGNAWKGGVSRHLYFGKGKFRLKKIFGDPLKCFYPDCDKEEGKNVRSLDCHHLDGNHENNPLDGTNWIPLCRKHHMLADGRLKSSTPEQTAEAFEKIKDVHHKHMLANYIGEVKTYHE